MKQQSYPGGDQYEGDFVNGEKQGKGIYKWANGDEYNGDWKNNKRNGQGMMLCTNGDLYEGSFVDDEKHGQGRYKWANGDEYFGDWKNNNRTGEGKMIWQRIIQYYYAIYGKQLKGRSEYEITPKVMDFWKSIDEITLSQQKQNISAVYTNGDVYEGNFVNCEKHGKGRFKWASGDQYYGDWKNNKRTGEGVNCEKHGKGKYKWKNQDEYYGDWKNSKRTGDNQRKGEDKMNYDDKSCIKEDKKDDEKHNEGKQQTQKGEIQKEDQFLILKNDQLKYFIINSHSKILNQKQYKKLFQLHNINNFSLRLNSD